MFRVCRSGAETVEVELVSVEESSGGAASGGRPFSVVFRGPVDEALSQGVRRMGREGIGDFEIFLVPVGISPGGGSFFYEAVFD